MASKIFSLLMIFLLIGIYPVIAQSQGTQQKNNYLSQNQEVIQKLEQHRNRFENKHNFTCNQECNYGEGENGEVKIQIREERRFLFFNVNMEENYETDSDGNIVRARYNFWSRLLNRKKLRV